MIAIVGGGLIGLACAWELGRRGLDAVVYEARPEQEAASWAGAGMIAPFAEHFPDELWQKRALDSAYLYPEWVREIGGDIDFVPATEAEDGHVDPRDLLRELRWQVRVERREVGDLEELEAEQVVVAAGAWSGALHQGGHPLPPTVPIKGYMLAWLGLPAGTVPRIVREGHTYVFQRRRGAVLAGSTEETVGFDRSVDAQKLAELERAAGDLVPALRGLRPAEHWLGFRPGTPDGWPVVMRWDERVVLAYGHFRNGILLAPWTAKWVASEVLWPSR